MNKVDFFIIGAPKCGTTSLAEYLKNHPDINFSRQKEPHFFATDFQGLQKINDIKSFEKYLGLFHFEDDKLTGEASTTYLFSEKAAQNILEYNPEAKMIIMLRNPLNMVVAWHGQKLIEKQEDEPKFEAAWFKQKARKTGQEIPELCIDAKMLFYKDWCLLGKQVQNIFQQVPKRNCHIIFFDDFVTKTSTVYRKTLNFLGLDYDDRTEFRAYNQHKQVRNYQLDEFRVRLNMIRKRNPLINKWHKAITKLIPGQGIGVQKFMLAINYKKAKRGAIDKDFRNKLIDEFHDDICLIERLTGRNLELWKRSTE